MLPHPQTQRSTALRAWMQLFRRWWVPLKWLWGVLILSIIINDGSSWLITKRFDISGTPLGWLLDHLSITLPSLAALLLLTLLAGLAHRQALPVTPPAVLHPSLSPQQRQQYIRAFQQEYTHRLNQSLQGRTAIALGLQERTDLLASSVHLVFQRTESAPEYSLPAGTSIVQVYDFAQRGFLLLGVPGSGKTTLLLELAQELLQRAESNQDQPLAIILNLSSWDAKKQPLTHWLNEQCFIAYGIPRWVSSAWLAHEQMLLLLDGLDEMEATARTACIEAINTYREEHQSPLVVCSRSFEYEKLQARLIISEVVEIRPITQQQVNAYLKRAGKSTAAVRAALQSNPTLRQLITTPLLLSIIVLTYRDRASKDLPQMGTPEEQQREIFNHYIDRMLERHRGSHMSFPSSKIVRSLTWLAQQMQQRHQTEFYLEQLQPTWLSTRREQRLYDMFIWLVCALVFGLCAGLVAGLAEGLAGALFGILFGGAGSMMLVGWTFREKSITPTEIFAWSWKRFWLELGRWLLVGSIGALLFGLGMGSENGLRQGLTIGSLGLAMGLAIGLSVGLAQGLSGTPTKIDLRLEPNQGTHQSGKNALRVGILAALLVGSATGAVIGLGSGQLFGPGLGLLAGSLFGLLIGLVAGLGIGLRFGGAAYLRHYLLRFLFWQSSALPWHAVRLFEEATECILLSRVGGGYRFIHPLLQEHFASLPITMPLSESRMTSPIS